MSTRGISALQRVRLFATATSVFVISFLSTISLADICSVEGLSKVAGRQPTCTETFAILKCAGFPASPSEADLARLSPKSSPAVTADVVEPLRRERDRLRSKMQEDLKRIAAAGEAASNESLSVDAVQISKKMVDMLADGMKRKGFKVEVRRQKAFDQIHEGVLYRIPERDVLVLQRGEADGALAREIDRVRTYIAGQKENPELPKEIKDSGYEFFVDPLLNATRDTLGFFSSSQTIGLGIHLAPGTIFNSQDAAVEIIRHELRHLKVHFDTASNPAAPYRFALYNKKEGIEELGIYGDAFAVDEVEGFLSNLKTSQSKMGRETEAYRKQLSKLPKESDEHRKTSKAFRKSLEKMQKEAQGHADRVGRFLRHSLEGAAEARRLIADPSMSATKFESLINVNEYTTVPNQVSVDIRISGTPSEPERVLNVRVPREVAAQGSEAIRNFTTENLVRLETLLLERSRQLQVRRSDIDRQPMERFN